MPSPTTKLVGATPWYAANAVRKSKLLGSPYIHASPAAACIAAIARGDGPKVFSFAPTESRAPQSNEKQQKNYFSFKNDRFGEGAFFENVFSPKGAQKNSQKWACLAVVAHWQSTGS